MRGKLPFGLLDEDPGKSHHAERDRGDIVSTSEDIEVRKHPSGGFLVIIRPDLEDCFLRSLRNLNMSSDLGNESKPIKVKLSHYRSTAHQVFREELVLLYEHSKSSGQGTFLVELEQVVRRIIESQLQP